VSWYLIDRAGFSLISALSQSPIDALRLVLALDGCNKDLVESGLDAAKLELAPKIQELGSFQYRALVS